MNLVGTGSGVDSDSKFAKQDWIRPQKNQSPHTSAGRCDLLANKAKFLFFANFLTLTMKLFAVVLSLSPFCSYSVSLVTMQISEPC